MCHIVYKTKNLNITYINLPVFKLMHVKTRDKPLLLF